MYKYTQRMFVTLTKKVCKSVVPGSTGLINNNFVVPTSSVSKTTLNALTCSIAKRYCTKTPEFIHHDNKDDVVFNPSVEVQKELQSKAQERLDTLLSESPEMDKFYKILELEIEVLRQSGGKVPNEIKPIHWLQLLKLKAQTKRRNFLEFLWINEVKKKNFKLKRKEAALLREVIEKKEEKETHLQYGLSNNTMFHRIYKTAISSFHNKKLINAMTFGEKIIMDCGFESHMTVSEISSCTKQLMFSFVSNRESKDPFDLHLVNVDPEGELLRKLKSFFPTMDDPGYPLNVTSQSYLELFPKEQLVYLTPHTNNVMQTYDPNKIYIIGAIVDKTFRKPLTLAKAKEEGIAVAKFPLDDYLEWKAGSGKVLNLNHCVDILLDAKITKDWDYAFRSVPNRKLNKSFSQYARPQVPKAFKNVEPKFQSAQASHVPDVAFQRQLYKKLY